MIYKCIVVRFQSEHVLNHKEEATKCCVSRLRQILSLLFTDCPFMLEAPQLSKLYVEAVDVYTLL